MFLVSFSFFPSFDLFPVSFDSLSAVKNNFFLYAIFSRRASYRETISLNDKRDRNDRLTKGLGKKENLNDVSFARNRLGISKGIGSFYFSFIGMRWLNR